MGQPVSAEIIHGDCLDVLREMPSASVGAVVTDPPYGINTKSDGSGKLNPWADLTNSAFWYREWIGECRRVLAPNGCLWSCLNWRSLVTFQKAACDLGWPITSLLVWDKEWIGPGGSQGLRPSYELVALWSMPDFAIVNRGLPDVQRFKWSGHKPHGHPAEKPPSLMRWLVQHSNARSVFDPFAGSGTVGEACLSLGVEYVGVEMDDQWVKVARQRLADAASQQTLAVA
jgi:site-specific DNA-methyltransferase (adenine-specific)